MPRAASAFRGFDRGAPQFLAELAAEMNREWFDANKARYTALWVEPMTALLTEVGARLAKAYAPTKLVAPKLFRIYRDTRFSKDKTPYKTHVAGVIRTAGDFAAMYVHFGLESDFVSAGAYFFDDRQLPKWRKLIAADKTGKELVKLATKAKKAGYEVGGHDDYKRVPKPYAEDHPRGDLLKQRGMTVGFPEIPRGMLHRAALADWLVEHAKAAAPLVTWIARNVRG